MSAPGDRRVLSKECFEAATVRAAELGSEK